MPCDPQPGHWQFCRSRKGDEPVTAKKEQVNHPAHYTAHPSGIEAITITSGFCFALGNVIKYVWRAGLKSPDPLPDLKKARWYLDYHIRMLEESKDGSGGPGGGEHH